MEKHIPYEKLSKKEKRKADAARRSTWGALNPVTRKPKTAEPIKGRRHGRKSFLSLRPFDFYQRS